MKGKKYKKSARWMETIYEKAFGLRKPYQILVDAEFCRELLKCKLIAKDLVPECLGGPTKIMVTGCTMDELRRMDQAGIGGDAMSGSVFIAKRFELRNCRHKASPDFTSSHCIKDLIADSNPHHYGVAAQNAELREGLREILGVPLLFVNRGVLLMEQPAKKTLSHAKSLELQKLKPAEFELKAITAKLGEEASTPTPIDKLKKKKKMKGRKQPNPLSVKKTSKNKKGEVVASSAAGAPPEGLHKPKRKRKPKKKAASDHTASSSS